MESPIGEPLATLPPRVPALRTGKPAKRLAKVLSRGRLDAAQLARAGDVQQLVEAAVLLGDPEADVGAAGDDLGGGVGGAGGEEVWEGFRSQIRKLWIPASAGMTGQGQEAEN